MKINMWKLLIAALIASTLSVACKDERDNFMVDDSISFVNTENYTSVSVYNEKCTLPVVKNGKGKQSASVTLSAWQEGLDAYNDEWQTNYVALPENCYKFTPKVSFGEKDTRKFIDITWDADAVFALDDTKNYVIPIRVSVDNDALAVDKNRELMLINLRRAQIGMDAMAEDEYSPSASRKPVDCSGTISLADPISVMDVTVNYEIDNTLVEAYNDSKGTDYKTAPEGLVSLAAKSSVIAAGQTSATFSCQINSAMLFEGNELKSVDENKYLVPVRLTSFSLDGIAITNEVAYIPIVMNKAVRGPWTVLEGGDVCYAKDPNVAPPVPAWIAGYTTEKLFDGSFANEFIPYWNTDNVFPAVFVADMGDSRVFTKFRISDSYNYQGNALNYEIYTAETYNGASTTWNLVASGKRDYEWANVGTNKDDPRLIYDYPVQKMIAGRYLKFVILKAERFESTGDYIHGRYKLGDVQGMGF